MKRNELKQIIKECIIEEGLFGWAGDKVDKGIKGAGKLAAKGGMYATGGLLKATGWTFEQLLKAIDFLTADQLQKLGDVVNKKAAALEEQKRRK